MQTWKARCLHPGWCGFWAGAVSLATLLFLAVACGPSQRPTTSPLEWIERSTACSEEEHLAVMQVSALTVSVPNVAGCTVQLQVLPDRIEYDRGDPVTVTARFSTQGDCTLHTPGGCSAAFAFYKFSARVLNQLGGAAALAEEGQWWEEYGDKLLRNKVSSGKFPLPSGEEQCYRLPLDRWYDLAAPGTYTLTLVYWGVIEMNPEGVAGNTITFTRRP
jgi:hypothetical protein